MKDIKQLQEEFENLGKSDYLAMVKFYEANIDSISNINPNQDDINYSAKMRLKSEYGLSLVNAGYYSKALPVLRDSINMFENATSIELDKLYRNTFFEHLLWNYGMALWETKEIPEANALFGRLVENYPENEKYRTWLNGTRVARIKKVTRFLWIIFTI